MAWTVVHYSTIYLPDISSRILHARLRSLILRTFRGHHLNSQQSETNTCLGSWKGVRLSIYHGIFKPYSRYSLEMSVCIKRPTPNYLYARIYARSAFPVSSGTRAPHEHLPACAERGATTTDGRAYPSMVQRKRAYRCVWGKHEYGRDVRRTSRRAL